MDSHAGCDGSFRDVDGSGGGGVERMIMRVFIKLDELLKRLYNWMDELLTIRWENIAYYERKDGSEIEIKKIHEICLLTPLVLAVLVALFVFFVIANPMSPLQYAFIFFGTLIYWFNRG